MGFKKEEEYYNKENICSFCDGKIEFPIDADPQKGMYKCSCGDGTRVGELQATIKNLKSQIGVLLDNYSNLQKYVKKHSKCKTCKGNQNQIPEGTTCPECGLSGLKIWTNK